VHWWWVTAHLYEQQISVGVSAVTQGCCEPVLQSSPEQCRVPFTKNSVAVHWCWVTAQQAQTASAYQKPRRTTMPTHAQFPKQMRVGRADNFTRRGCPKAQAVSFTKVMPYIVCSSADAQPGVSDTLSCPHLCTAAPCFLGAHTGSRTWPCGELDPAACGPSLSTE